MYDAALIGDGWADALDALSLAAGSRGVGPGFASTCAR
jgi:hypothetical protein